MSATENRLEFTSQDRLHIEEQLQRLLRHPLFQQSKYLPSFLAYIVREALDPRSDGFLKERTVGVEVFSRRPDYDNNSDPVVRVTATALRKKLAQYYYENGHQDEIRIELRPGTYIPTFRPSLSKEAVADLHVESLLEEAGETETASPNPALEEPIRDISSSASSTGTRHLSRWIAVGLCLVLVAGAAYLSYRTWRGDQAALDDFWAQTSNGVEHISVVMPVIGSDDLVSAVASVRNESARPVLSLEDTNLAARVSAQLQRSKAHYQIVSSADVTLGELRNGPAVFIGALDNIWTMRLTKELPFAFEESLDNKTGRIVEASGGQHRSWVVDIDRPHVSINRDYGIVARFDDHLTGQPTIIIAGISSQGTQAAGELLTSIEYKAIRSIASKSKNFEIVLQTEAIDGHAGQPKIIATRVW